LIWANNLEASKKFNENRREILEIFEVLREGSSGACTLELDRRIFARGVPKAGRRKLKHYRTGGNEKRGSNVAQEVQWTADLYK
jgi:hypothetical protein